MGAAQAGAAQAGAAQAGAAQAGAAQAGAAQAGAAQAGAARTDTFTCGRTGGELTFGLEANIAGLDQHTSSATSTRDGAANIFEALVTRDEHMKPILGLAQSVAVSPDNRVFTFRLRPGVHFHNGKLMTAADVLASFERYKRVGLDRSVLAPVASWDTPDPMTFAITLKQPYPTFLESVSSVTVPIVIVPAENADAPPQQLKPVGTGPYMVDEFVPGSFLRLKRFDGYAADTRYPDRSGYGGYKVACLDRVTFRMVTEPEARVAGLQTGELQAVQDVPPTAQARLAKDPAIRLMKIPFYWLNIGYPNWSAPPTDNVKFRQAVLAALDFNEIMEAASDGDYTVAKSLQIPGTTYYSEAGAALLNQHDPARAKRLLAEAGYHGQKVVLLTNKDYPTRYNTALVMAEQMKAAGINAQLLVLDWPTALQKSQKGTPDWNFFFSGWMTYIAQGGQQTLRTMAEPSAIFTPPGGKVDPQFMRDYEQTAYGATEADRKAAFARAQQRALETVMVIPFGAMPKTQGVRANVEHYQPFWNPACTTSG